MKHLLKNLRTSIKQGSLMLIISLLLLIPVGAVLAFMFHAYRPAPISRVAARVSSPSPSPVATSSPTLITPTATPTATAQPQSIKATTKTLTPATVYYAHTLNVYGADGASFLNWNLDGAPNTQDYTIYWVATAPAKWADASPYIGNQGNVSFHDNYTDAKTIRSSLFQAMYPGYSVTYDVWICENRAGGLCSVKISVTNSGPG